MKPSIVDQLKTALEILEDYPGIENVLNVTAARALLNELEDTARKIGIPSFTGLNHETIEAITKNLSSTHEKWQMALANLPHVSLFDYDSDHEDEEKGIVFWGVFPADLREAHPDYDRDYNGWFRFYGNGRAELGIKDETKEGSWNEIYHELAKFVHTQLECPAILE